MSDMYRAREFDMPPFMLHLWGSDLLAVRVAEALPQHAHLLLQHDPQPVQTLKAMIHPNSSDVCITKT